MNSKAQPSNLSAERIVIKASEPVSYKRLPLTAILEPDAFALQWARAVRARFPNAKPIWGVSSVGNVGRDPQIGSVPWRDWWEGLA